MRFSIILLCPLLAGCAWRRDGTSDYSTRTRDRRLYQAMQLEMKAQEWEYGNLDNWNALQGCIERNGIERSKLEGLWK